MKTKINFEFEMGHLLCHYPDLTKKVVVIKDCFPASMPGKIISVQDLEGKEQMLIDESTELDTKSRLALRLYLDELSFKIIIKSIISIEEDVEMRHYHVISNKGERRFQTRPEDWPKLHENGDISIYDIYGDCYLMRSSDNGFQKARQKLGYLVD